MSKSCARFWGPFHSFTVAELGTSFWLPSFALVFTRFVSGVALLAIGLADIHERPNLIFSETALASIISSLAYFFLVVIALQVTRTPKISALFASIAGVLHQIGASLSLYAFIILIARIAAPLREIDSPLLLFLSKFMYGEGHILDSLPICLMIIDFALGSKIRFRLALVLIPVLVLFIQTAAHFMYLRNKIPRFARAAYVLYHFPAFFKFGSTAFERLYVAQHLTSSFCAAIVVLFSRISMIWLPTEHTSEQLEANCRNDEENGKN